MPDRTDADLIRRLQSAALSGRLATVLSDAEFADHARLLADAIARLEALSRAATPPPGTVRVRVAVAVAPGGEWYAAGWSGHWEDPAGAAAEARERVPPDECLHWVEADVPLPATVAGRVSPAGGSGEPPP